MKITSIFLALLTAGVVALPAQASDALAQKHSCLACHAKDTKVLGPALMDVAKRYGSQAEVVATLTKTILEGSSGKWGNIPMPPNAKMSVDDARALAVWILSLK
jgi:cytochrome c